MKALVIHAANDLRIEEYPVEAITPDEVQISIAAGGVCGSDLHYFHNGGFGSITLKEPMVLGHEVAGHITQVGENVTDLNVGDLVAVSPSRPCGHCQYCQKGQRNHCLNMRFYGSAMPFPHIQGAFRQTLNADASQCVIATGLSAGEAAMAEPLSVVLHAMKQAGELLGKRVLITGCGPIGVLCVLAARRAGAVEIVTTDLSDNALSFANASGADRTLNTGKDAQALNPYTDNKGYFDVLFECSGAAPALTAGLHAMAPRGVVVQLGLGGDMSLPMMAITAKELSLKGSFRFHEEFAVAVSLMAKGLIDVKPLITHTVSLDDSLTAFEVASDRNQAMKAQIKFNAV
jgi:L-idonate 5-dehydrogenase